MGRLNGWRRLWVVVSVLWVSPFLLALFAIGLPPVYLPPTLNQGFVMCRGNKVRDDVRKWYTSHSKGQKMDDQATQNGFVPLEMWRVRGDTSPVDLCTSSTTLVFNPK